MTRGIRMFYRGSRGPRKRYCSLVTSCAYCQGSEKWPQVEKRLAATMHAKRVQHPRPTNCVDWSDGNNGGLIGLVKQALDGTSEQSFAQTPTVHFICQRFSAAEFGTWVSMLPAR
jgi:hypothetical protein